MTSQISTLLAAPAVDWQAVLDAAIADFGGTTGTLHRLDPVTGMLTLVAHHGIPPQIMPMIRIIPGGNGPAHENRAGGGGKAGLKARLLVDLFRIQHWTMKAAHGSREFIVTHSRVASRPNLPTLVSRK